MMAANPGTDRYEKTIWVRGVEKRCVMAERQKWAFGAERAAQVFACSQSGPILSGKWF